MLLCGLNVVASIAIAAFSAERASVYEEAAAACNADGSDVRSQSEKDDWNEKERNASVKIIKSTAASVVIEAAVLVLIAAGFLLFSPPCIVMFRRVERRLDAIMQEMALRSDVGTVLLPCEFSTEAGDGTRTQEEMPIVEARVFLGRMKSAAAAQRLRFFLCLGFVLTALIVLAAHAVFIARYSAAENAAAKISTCSACDSCQPLDRLMLDWYDHTPEFLFLVASACTSLPLMFSLRLMMTKDDLELLLHPHRFRTDAICRISHSSTGSTMDERLKSEFVRMGVELR
jgi:hypothetical protein